MNAARRTVGKHLAALTLTLLAGCAVAPSAPPRPHRNAIAAFVLEGRLSIRQGDKPYASNIEWQHTPDGDRIFLSGPLGQGIAELSRDATGATLLTADRRTVKAADWSSLAEALLGIRLPLYASQVANQSVEMAGMLQQSAATIGLNLAVNRVPADSYWSSHWFKHPATFGNSNPRPTADLLFSTLFQSSAPWNESGWRNERFDSLLVAARGEGDARDDLDGQYETWFSGLRPAAIQAFGLPATLDRETRSVPLYNVEPASTQGGNPAVSSAGARLARVLENRELLTAPDRSTRHIEIALPDGATYRAGDHLAVVPRNDAALVAAIAKRLGHSPDDVIRLRGAEGRRALLPLDEPVSVGKLLSDYVELQQVATRKQIQTMAEHTRCPVTRPKLEALSGESDEAAAAYRAEVLARRKSVYDLLEEFPACELPLAAYLEMTPLLQPRYYSISSSPKADPQRCTVTVGVVEGPARSGRGTYRGVCSNYLAARAADETIFAAVRETKAGFRLPDDPKVPLIMIGPGTGLAPFRGFCQERAAQKKAGASLGPAMLFFGCRHPGQDFLYAEELKGHAADGVIELHTAFSRMDGQAKTYVQDLVRSQQDRVWALIEAGAIVYICGDGGKMEPDVKRALVEIYCARKNATADAGEAWINEMGAGNRYVLDVWAGG